MNLTKKSQNNPVTPTEYYPDLAKAVGVKELCLKREDLHPYGSHKGRSIPVMIDTYYRKGDRHFVISSSGNAGIAAAVYTNELNSSSRANDPLEMDIFISNNVDPHKAERLHSMQNEHVHIFIKERPLQALTQAINEGSRSLRQSTDDISLIGYKSLAEELLSEKKLGAVFIGTSSGTTAQALAQYFKEKKSSTQVHFVQTSSCHPIAETFETYDGPDEKSIADAIVDKVAHRKTSLLSLIKDTNGRGWIVTNDEIETAKKITLEYSGVEISDNSALSVAGAMKASALGWEFSGTIACIICGE